MQDPVSLSGTQRLLHLAVAVAGSGEMERFVADGLGDRGPVAAMGADVDDGWVTMPEVADGRHAELAARAAAGRR